MTIVILCRNLPAHAVIRQHANFLRKEYRQMRCKKNHGSSYPLPIMREIEGHHVPSF